jgi:hypothetical protein
VSLGGWLVTEGWILPSLFDGIPNKDLMVNQATTMLLERTPQSDCFLHPCCLADVSLVRQDGSSLQFRSLAWNANLTAERGGGAAVVAVPDSQLNGSYATFKV